MHLQEEEADNNQQSTSFIMKSEFNVWLPSRNIVASDDRGGEDTSTVTPLE